MQSKYCQYCGEWLKEYDKLEGCCNECKCKLDGGMWDEWNNYKKNKEGWFRQRYNYGN